MDTVPQEKEKNTVGRRQGRQPEPRPRGEEGGIGEWEELRQVGVAGV